MEPLIDADIWQLINHFFVS